MYYYCKKLRLKHSLCCFTGSDIVSLGSLGLTYTPRGKIQSYTVFALVDPSTSHWKIPKGELSRIISLCVVKSMVLGIHCAWFINRQSLPALCHKHNPFPRVLSFSKPPWDMTRETRLPQTSHWRRHRHPLESFLCTVSPGQTRVSTLRSWGSYLVHCLVGSVCT